MIKEPLIERIERWLDFAKPKQLLLHPDDAAEFLSINSELNLTIPVKFLSVSQHNKAYHRDISVLVARITENAY